MSGTPEAAFYVRNGYIVPMAGWTEAQCMESLLQRAGANDSEALRILDSLPVTAWEILKVQQECGVRVDTHTKTGFNYYKNEPVVDPSIHISAGQYPPRFRGSSLEHLQRHAEQGNLLAARVLGYITRERIVHDRKIIDHPA